MELDLFILHFAILFSALVFAYFWHVKTLRLKASFDLYRVRDKFILLVASGSLTEDDEVFKHFYNRINALLKTAPNVGIDDILQAVFCNFKSPEEFTATMEKVKNKVKKLHGSPAMQKPGVNVAVAEFYQAVQTMLLSHSSIVRLFYILSKKMMHDHLVQYLPQSRLRRGLDAVEYAEVEARSFAV